jgi:hypothetical protein
VTVFITDLTTLTNHTLTPPPDTDQDHYLVFGGWLNSSVAMVTWMNRSSDTAVYCLYSESSSWQCTPIYNQTSPLTPGWIELVQSPTILEDGGGSILTFASRKEGDDSFLHILELSQDSVTVLTLAMFTIICHITLPCHAMPRCEDGIPHFYLRGATQGGVMRQCDIL